MAGHNQTQLEAILVVDDDPEVRESMSLFLDAKGYSVLEAKNGQEALEVLKRAPRFPCLVVLDLFMPVLDGQGFLEHRAQDPFLRVIPVIVISGNDKSDVPLEDVAAYLSKPVKPDRLVEILDHLSKPD
jgi:two-component system, chemotaxis family, chemotaxis protein CheY